MKSVFRLPPGHALIALLQALPILSSAAESGLDENALFSDTTQIEDSRVRVSSDPFQSGKSEEKIVGLSGNILSVMQTGVSRSWFAAPQGRETSFGAAAVGDADLDVRMARGFRAFAELEWSLDATAARASAPDSGTTFRVPELFLDANIAHRVYLRTGKQVLQWGPGTFFNPTDLVNVERKSFLRRIGGREGTSGVRVHVPFGTTANLYGFLDTHGTGRPDSLSGAIRAEWLIGRTEVAAMVWSGGGRQPVYGTDFSSRVFDLDVTGEFALYSRFDTRTAVYQAGVPVVRAETRNWQSRYSVSAGRGFRVSGIQDRLYTTAEYYSNGPGTTDRRMPDLILIGAANAYEPNAWSRHYAAFFATFSRFVRSDVSLAFNAISNLNQQSTVLASSIAYRDLNDFGLTFTVYGMAGRDRTEYTLSGQAVDFQLIAEASF